MDPNSALVRLIDAACDGDTDELMAAAEDLTEWINSGGFKPTARSVMLDQVWFRAVGVASG